MGAIQGPLKSGDSTDDTTPTLTGKAEPGNVVTVYDDGKPVGSVVADPSGNWNYTVPAPGLTEGEHAITATQADPAGNTSAPTSPFDVVIDTTIPVASAVITGVTDDTGVNAHDYITNDNTLIINGNTTAPLATGDKVQVRIDGGQWADAKVNADGTWSYDNTANPFTDGNHVVEARVIDAAGNYTPLVKQDITIDTLAPIDSPTSIDSVMDDVGSVQGPITNSVDSKTDDTRPDISGKAPVDADHVNIYDNGKLLGTATVKADGTWTFTPETPLTAGPHSLTAVAEDKAGNVSPASAPWQFGVVGDAPPAPTIQTVADDFGSVQGPIQKNGVTDDKTPTISGTAQPGSVVHVYVDGKEVGTATVSPDKTWSLELPDLGVDGPKNITAQAVDAAGQASPMTGEYPIILDTTAPAKPGTITAEDDVGPKVGDIKPGDTTDDTTPSLSGTGEPGDKVTIYDNGQPVGSTTVKPDGTWSYTPDAPLVEGPHKIEVSQTDPAGNESPKSDPLDFTVDSSAVQITISASDNQEPNVGPIAKGGLTNDNTPVLSGTTKAGQVVTIKDEAGKTVGSATADANGKWSVELPTQADGAHTYTASTTLPSGVVAEAKTDFTIDSTAPVAPSVDSVTDDVGAIQGPLKSGDSTDDTTPTLTGKAEPGNVVTVYDDGKPVGSVVADPSGNWNYTVPAPGLTEGEHAITATQTDPAGNVSAPSAPFDVVIDITPPTVTATITGITDDTGTVGDFITKDPTLIISGKVSDASQIQAGDKVQVSVDGGKWVDATLKADGTWSYDNTVNPLTEGKHVVEARVVDKAGNAGSMTSQDVTIDTMPPNPLSDLDLKDDVGEVQGTIPNNGFTDDTRPEFTGKAPADVSVVNVYDNGQLIGSTTVNPDGTWSFTPDVSLTGGQHSLTATPIDVAGNEGPVTTPWVFDLLVTPPQSPVITSVEDNFGSVTGPIEKTVGVTDDKMPTVSGTGEIGTTIHVYSAGVVVGTAIVQPDGTWSVEVSDLGVDGVKDLTAQAVDKAGQLSPITGDFSFILDTAAPAKPTLAADDNVGKVQGPIHSGDVTDDTTPTFSGQGEPNSAVKIVDNGVEIGTVYVKPDGTWSFTPTTPLDNGSHLVTVTQTDPAGNKSIPSDPLSFEVDDRNVKITIEASDNEQPIIGPIMQGGYTNDDTPVLSGTTDAGAIVTITDKDGKAIVSVTADVNGIWTTELPHQADGAQAYTATAKLANGDTAEASIDFNIDTTKPVGLTIDSVMDDVGLIQGPLTSGDHSDDTTPTLAGTAEAFNWVNIYDNNQLVGSIQADGNGHWSYTIPTPGLADGLHALTATQTDKAGNVSDPTAPFDVVVDTIAPTDKAAVISISDDTGTLGDYVTSDNTLIINAKPIVPLDAGDKVQITLDGGVTWLDATNNGNGTWSYDNTGHVLADGTYKFGARVVDQAGNLGQQTLTEVVIDTVLEPAPTINMSNYQDNGDLATDFYSNDDQFTLNVTGEKGAQVVYQTLIDGQWTDLNTATIGADGTSSYDVDWSKLALDNVDRKFRAVVTDLAGNTATTYVGGTTEATAQNYKIDNVAAQGYFDYSNSTSNATGGLNTKGAFFQFSEAGERVFTIYKEDYRGAGHDENSQQIGADVIFKTDANGKLDVASALSYLDPFKNYVFKTVDAAGNVSVTDKYINVLTDPLKAYTSGNYVQWYYKPYNNLKEFSASAFMETDGVNFYNDAANLAGFATRFDGTGYWGETSVYLTLADGSKFSDGSSQKVTTVDENGYWEYSYNGFNPVNAGQLAGVRLVATHLQDLAETDTANYRVDLDIHAFKNGGNNGTAVYQVVGSYSNINAPIQYFKGQADTGAHDWKASIDHQVYTSTRDNDAFYSNGVATTVIYKVLDTVTAEMNSGGLYLGETGTTIGNGYGSQFDLDTFGNSNTNGWIDRNGDDRISINTTGKDFVDVNGDGIYDGLTGKGTDVGMHVTDMWNHFDASKDKIDLTDWMAQIKAETGTTVNSINISQFLQEHDVINAKTGAVSTVLSIDRDGAGSVYQSTQFLTLENSGHIDFNDLLKNNIIY
ncbi:Ig-like domain-containing protein [Acinetobacter sp. ANC 3832]|uniref:Ig-like domain-containing protein n=1 Tax=Acinetobacter sp. ANC 3832 TaxID=1977874 RepID=UPI001BB46901|nr:Ig-like domain-containing protein [Acinetobacter sp. ANC 3832]